RALAIENLLTEDEGVLINAVVENSPAAHAQIQVNSILLKIDGVSVNSPSGVVRIIGSMVPGKMVHLSILLKGEYTIVSVSLTNSKK
ncbi:PDZ domain-containing protein, partial [Candidatus Gottesmanbacteria bacterium]|nr:PDZ domain-containing protein [Candidatus Gottesmanbacteria bacterium]